MKTLQELKEAVIIGNTDMVERLISKAVAEGLSVDIILNDGLIAGMEEIGIRFKNKEVYVPEMLIASRAMHTGLKAIKSLIPEAGLNDKGTIVMGTVKGDLHDIGKNLVIMMLEGAGYKVYDIGIDASAEIFIKAIDELQPDIVGLSALLTTTMVEMKKAVKQIKIHSNIIKVMVGGAPVTQKFAMEINADGYAPDAASAVDIAKKLIVSK